MPVVSGIATDLTPKQSKTWTWSADKEAQFRFAINQSPTWSPSGNFTNVNTAGKTGVDGTWYLHVQARNSLGIVSKVKTVSAVLDTTPPLINGLSNANQPQQSVQWSWSANEKATYRYTIDQNQEWTPKGDFSAQSQASKASVDGTWYLHVQAKDEAGNIGSIQTVSALLDNTAPVLIGLADNATLTTSKTWSWSASEACTYRYVIDQSEDWTPQGDFKETTEASTSGVDGTWYLHVQAQDLAGNVGAVTTVSTLLDSTLPLVSIEPAGGKYSTCNPVQITLTSTEAADIYYTKDGTNPTTDSLSSDVVYISQSRVIKAMAVDAAGNQGQVVTATFVIDCPDSDEDGINNELDLDDDNDGLSDLEEELLGMSSTLQDTDNDGLLDPDDPDPLQDNFSVPPELAKANTTEQDPQLITLQTLYQDSWSDEPGNPCFYELTIHEPGNYNLLVRPVANALAEILPGQGKMLCELYTKSATGDLTYLRGSALVADKPQHVRLPLLKGTYLLKVQGKDVFNTTFELIALKSDKLYDLLLHTDSETGLAVQPLVIPEEGRYRFFMRLHNSTLGNETAQNMLNATLYAGKQGVQAAEGHVIHTFGPGVEICPELNFQSGWVTLQVHSQPGHKVRFWAKKTGQSSIHTEREPNQSLSKADSLLPDQSLNSGQVIARNATLGQGLDTDLFAFLVGKEDEQTEHSLYIDISIVPETQPQDSILRLKLLQSSGESLKTLTFTGKKYNGQLANSVQPGLYFLKFGSYTQKPLQKTVEYSLQVKDVDGVMYSQPEDQQAEQLIQTDYLGLLQMIMYLQEWQENQTENKDILGNAVIVNGVGDVPEDALHVAARALSDYAYKIFYERGLGHEAIWYMSADEQCDWNGDGQNDEVADVSSLTVQALEQAITEWATGKSSVGPLFVYLVDHGGDQAFQLSQTNNAILYAGTLDQMLDTFQDATGRPVVVLMEACYSGSFAAKLNNDGRPDRAVLLSSQAGQKSYIEPGGAASFSRFVLKKLGQGHQLQNAFHHSKQTICSDAFGYYVEQTPQASFMDLGGQYLGTGYLTAGQDLIEASMTSKFVSAEDSQGVYVDPAIEDHVQLSAHVYSVTGLKRVWATVLPPDYEPPQVGEEFETPDLSQYTVNLVYNAQSNRYEGSYVLPEGAVAGDYDLTYFLEDVEGTLASSKDMGESTESGTLGFGAGWNLAGLWLEPEDSAWEAVLDDALDDITSVWAWAGGNWQVALPSMTGQAEADYLDTKGFSGLSELSCGHGFWVNAVNATSVQLSGSLPQDQELSFTPGWSLLGVKGTKALDAASFTQNTSILSVWKWSEGKWSVSLPGAEDKGTDYAKNKGFSVLQAIQPGEGFWVNCQ